MSKHVALVDKLQSNGRVLAHVLTKGAPPSPRRVTATMTNWTRHKVGVNRGCSTVPACARFQLIPSSLSTKLLSIRCSSPIVHHTLKYDAVTVLKESPAQNLVTEKPQKSASLEMMLEPSARTADSSAQMAGRDWVGWGRNGVWGLVSGL